MLKNVFDTVMGTTSGPDVNIFNRFNASWPAINTTKYCRREDVVSEEVRGNMITFLEEQLQCNITDMIIGITRISRYLPRWQPATFSLISHSWQRQPRKVDV